MSTKIRVVGVTHSNADGISRQEILAKCKAGDRCWLVPEPENHYDKNAIRVATEHGYLGYIPATVAEKLPDALKQANGEIEAIFGGTAEKPTRGCLVSIE